MQRSEIDNEKTFKLHPMSKPMGRMPGLLRLTLLMWAVCGAVTNLAMGQIVTATLSGTVQDPDKAVIPGANVSLTNTLSGDTRSTVSNSSGFFSFAGINSGDYSVTVSATSFKSYTVSGIHLDPGDSRTVPSVVLSPGNSNEAVTVTAETGDVPLDTGERANLITAEQIKHLSVEGRDVTELLKTLPGFAITNQGINNSAYDPSQVNVNGALGNYSANGNPIQGIYLMLDGADITDPGNYGAALQNVNYDQVGEVKVQVSNFGADVSNGPVVISAVTKAGGDRFHGQVYTYARTSQLDSTDALAKATQQQKPGDREIYPGFTVGGPVLIPGTNFNKNRHLTFFAGAEEYAQRNIYAYGNASGALVHALVPTANMRAGNFSAAELQNYLGPELYANASYQNISAVPTFTHDGQPISGGMIASSYADPGFAAIFNNMPLPNATPTLANPYNWQSTNLINDNLWEAVGRVDLAISERNHFFGRYTVERGKQGVPGVPYYNQGELNTPGGGIATANSESAAANLTTILSSTMTNQLFGSLGYLNAPFDSENHAALTAYPYQGAFANGRHPLPELGNYDDAGGLPRQLTPDYSLSPVFARKFDPQGGDNLTKVWGTHTVVAGFLIEKVINNSRVPFVPTNGSLSQYYLPGAGQSITDVDGTSAVMSGNWVANNYQGYVSSYQQQNVLPAANLYFWDNAFFATDSWQIKQRLTVNYGVRFQHLGLWNDAYGNGIAIFRPSLIASSTSPYPGFLWHAYDHSIPVSGNASKPFYIEPRFGASWDIRGNGQTVLQGGWGEYRSHDNSASPGNALSQSQFAQNVSYGGGGLSLAAVSHLDLPASAVPPVTNTIGLNSTLGTYYGLTDGDRQQPLTDTYSVTLNQQLPHKLNMLLGYVGNNSRFLLNDGSNQSIGLDNVNAIPVGGLYKPNPITGQVLTPTGTVSTNTTAGASTATINQYRPLNTPLVQYGAIQVPNHVLFANYNALQLGLTHTDKHVLFNTNYTWGKALGIRGAAGTGIPGDPFHIWNNYGPESFDRRHIFNATYTFMVGSPVHQKLVGPIVNGWEVSGITTLQSGPDISSLTTNPGLSLSGNIGQQNLPDGTTNPNYITINNSVYLGTPDVSLQPTLTCNPAQNHTGPHQYINGTCFGTPNLLQNGPFRLPYLTAPAYFNSDLSLQKSVHTFKEQNLQFRISSFNFLNHPLHTFTSNFQNEYQLNLTNQGGTQFNQGALDPSLGFGYAPYTSGRRVVELLAKYNF